MCGRTACTLQPQEICNSCQPHLRKDFKNECTSAVWKDAPNGGVYYPSYNICPGSYTPVVFASEHRKDLENDVQSTYIIQPMLWGLVPHWSDNGKVAYSTNNARSDGMLTKTTYKQPLSKGRRCVVVCEGYFEWHTGKDGKKQPYYLYPPEDVSKACGKPLLFMAGIFDVWHSKAEEGSELFSYAVVTVDAHKDLSWLHDRMPAILLTTDAIQDWLDYSRVPLKEATALIRPVPTLRLHPVSTLVNNSSHKGEDLIKPVDLQKSNKPSASSTFMQCWLKGTKRTPEKTTVSEEPKEKKPCL